MDRAILSQNHRDASIAEDVAKDLGILVADDLSYSLLN